MFGIVIDKNTGFVFDRCVVVKDYTENENEDVIHFSEESGNPVGNMNKPRWDFDNESWIDTEPLEEIVVENPKSENEILQERLDQLEAEKSILAQNVYDMATIIEYIILGGAE